MTESTSSVASPMTSAARGISFERVYVWELPVRITHWLSAICLVVLFATGHYIAHPIAMGRGEAWNSFAMGYVREVHFGAAYLFTASLLLRFAWFVLGNEHARSGIPRLWRPHWWQSVFGQAFEYAKFDAGQPHLGHNAMAGLSYALFMGLLGVLQLVTGFALYAQSTPGGFWDGLVGWITPLVGGVYATAMLHHLFAWGFAFFAVLHVYIVLFDSSEYRNGLIGSIIDGYKFRKTGARVDED